MKYRKKPVVIEAMQFTGDIEEVRKFIGGDAGDWFEHPEGQVNIHTLEGIMRADVNDYIIKGIKGEFYPIKPDIFEKTYEAVKES